MRAFIAFPIPEGVREALAEAGASLAQRTPEFRVTPKSNFHGTLLFLGEIALADAERATTAMRRTLSSMRSFTLELRGAGRFPETGTPRVAWIGGGRGSEECRALADGVRAAVEPLGFALERERFSLHVTVARLRRSVVGDAPRGVDAWLRAWAERSCGEPFAVDRVMLYASELRGGIRRYVEQASITLR